MRFATQTFAQGPRELIGHFERERIDPSYSLAGRSVPANAWDSIFFDMENLEDSRDFRALDVLAIRLAYTDHPALDPALMPRVREALLSFKYRLSDLSPPGTLDTSVYWTENHHLTYATLEYLAGALFPADLFPKTGLIGQDLQARGRESILRWIDSKARYGFSEFHSNVYYAATLRPLLLLADFAPEPALAERARMVVDLLVLDLALNTYQGTFGVPHGRSYKKDKTSGLLEDTWNITKLLFGTSGEPHQLKGSSALYFARSTTYRLPSALLGIARDPARYVSRERLGVPIAERGPWEPSPAAPFGYSYTSAEDLWVWWGMGAHVTWPVLPLTVSTLDERALWDTPEFAPLAPFRELVSSDLVRAQRLAIAAAPMVNANLLSQVNTYTFRTEHGMLASAVDYRAGSAGVQGHAWQATLDPRAVVFTNHPLAPLVPSADWSVDYGYFTGEASWPRAAQHRNVGIYLYAPQWPSQSPPPFDAFSHQALTHAYFPQDHFDEVSHDGHWTIARRGSGYVALYSWRPASFVPYDPARFATGDMVLPFDLLAPGGASNVWIAELGSASEWPSFAAFERAIRSAPLEVQDLGIDAATRLPLGFEVRFQSPSQGRMEFGWQSPLRVRGRPLPLGDFPRVSSPWVEVPFGSTRYEIEHGPCRLMIDFVGEGQRKAVCD